MEETDYIDKVHVEYDSDEEEDEVKFHHNWRDEFDMRGTMSMHVPMRISIMEYDEADMVFSKNNRLEPEIRHSADLTQATIPRLFPPLFGYPVKIQNQVMTLGRNLKSMQQLLNLLEEIKVTKRMWAPRDLVLETVTNPDVLSCYKYTPLHAFNSIAIEESQTVSDTDSIWRVLYDSQVTFIRHPGVYGTIHDNSLIDVRPYEEDDESGSFSTELRISKDEWLGFIDCTYTPGSVEAGRIRSLAHNIRYRSMTAYTIDCASELLRQCCNPIRDKEDTWTLFMLGYIQKISKLDVFEMTATWLTQYGPNAPSLHVFEDKKVVVIAITPGCLMKPVCEELYEDNSNIKWYDSVLYNDQSMTLFMDPDGDSFYHPLEYMRTFCHLVPFVFHDEPPRPLLAGSMSTQAICNPRVELFSTIKPKHVVPPIVRTPLMDKYVRDLARLPHVDIPGVELLTLFCNSRGNYEDSVIVSQYVNDRGIFAHTSLINHPVPVGVDRLRAGDVIGSETKWWRPAQDAVVIKEGFSKNKTRYVCARMTSNGINVGDKIGTQHGQKFTVSEVRPIDQMPTCFDSKTGKTFKPHIIVASSSIHNRITLGQLYEAYTAMSVIDDVDFDPLNIDDYVVLDTDGRFPSDIKATMCHIRVGDTHITHPNISNDLYMDYGICRFWLLAHLSRDKQHYLSHVPRGPTVPKGRLHGSSVRLGEMEVHVMLMNGLIHTLSELTMSSDMVEVSICVNCRRLTILCDCNQVHHSTNVVTRLSTVKFDICRAIYTLHSTPRDPELFTGNDVSLPSSFTYHV